MVVKVRGHYDQDKTANINVRKDGTISLRTYKAACKRAGLIEGDYLILINKDMFFIYNGETLWGILA